MIEPNFPKRIPRNLTRQTPPSLPERPNLPKRVPPCLPERSDLSKSMPPSLPVQSNRCNTFILQNRGLSDDELNKIIHDENVEVRIRYSGTGGKLNFLFEQLHLIKNMPINLIIEKCDIDYSLCLPLYNLNNKLKIFFTDSANLGAGFNSFLMNCNDVIFQNAVCFLDESARERVVAERKIKNKLVNYFNELLGKNNLYADRLSKKRLMDLLFLFVKENYPYDFSIVGNNGSFVPGVTSQLGGTARSVYERGKGVCSGRSKLLKLMANNSDFGVPCYIVDGEHGQLGHTWNEFIDDNGDIFEYDLSFNTKCLLSELQRRYPMYHNLEHEKPVERLLRR